VQSAHCGLYAPAPQRSCPSALAGGAGVLGRKLQGQCARESRAYLCSAVCSRYCCNALCLVVVAHQNARHVAAVRLIVKRLCCSSNAVVAARLSAA
jgi:hypothetical protein